VSGDVLELFESRAGYNRK